MKRQILFRGKRVDNGKWIEGYLVVNKDGTCWIKDTDYQVNNDKNDLIPHEVIPETIGQFTCLTDRNGVKIFEDDIIKIVEDGDKKTDNRPEDFNYGDVALILFDSRYCQFGAYNNSIDEIESIGNLVRTPWFNFIEVIGNIHDNPELLK